MTSRRSSRDCNTKRRAWASVMRVSISLEMTRVCVMYWSSRRAGVKGMGWKGTSIFERKVGRRELEWLDLEDMSSSTRLVQRAVERTMSTARPTWELNFWRS